MSLSTIIQLKSGMDLQLTEVNDKQKGTPYLTGASNFTDGILQINRWCQKPKVISHKNDILITVKGTIGDIAQNSIGDCHIARQIMAITPYEKETSQYIEIFLRSVSNKMRKASTSLIPGIRRETILSLIIPLPPLSEQKRIVKKTNYLLANISKLSKEALSIRCLGEQLKTKILNQFFQYADSYKSYYMLYETSHVVMGQSVPGSSMLDKPSNESIEFHQGKIEFGEKWLDKSKKFTCNPPKVADSKSILLSVRAPVGEMNLCDRKIGIGRGLCSIKPYDGFDFLYIYYSILARKEWLKERSTGSTFQAVQIKTVKEIPVPKLGLIEQQNISKSINNVFLEIDNIIKATSQ